jgi:hypothetical protein
MHVWHSLSLILCPCSTSRQKSTHGRWCRRQWRLAHASVCHSMGDNVRGLGLTCLAQQCARSSPMGVMAMSCMVWGAGDKVSNASWVCDYVSSMACALGRRILDRQCPVLSHLHSLVRLLSFLAEVKKYFRIKRNDLKCIYLYHSRDVHVCTSLTIEFPFAYAS